MDANVTLNDGSPAIHWIQAPTPNIYAKERGHKMYELSDHLGNVQATISDRKEPYAYDEGSSVQTYLSVLLSRSEVYPFGWGLPGRSFNASEYRYGFNGMENDNEIKGTENSVNYKYRMHDPRIGRFFAVDILAHKYPNLSSYSFVANNPILNIEVDGRYFITKSTTFSGKKELRIHVTDFRWVEKVSNKTAIPLLGIPFELALWGAKGQDPSFDVTDSDIGGAALTLLGYGSAKLIKKLGGGGEFLLSMSRSANESLLSALTDQETSEIALEYLAIKSLESKGMGKVHEGKEGEKQTSHFVFNQDIIDDITNDIISDKELTSKEGFKLDSEVSNRMSKLMDGEK